MKITKLHLQNFRQFEDLEINFPETSNIAVFIGENGCGKSTVLDAIAIHLQKIAKWAMTNDTIDFNEMLPSKEMRKNKTQSKIDAFFNNIYGVDMRFNYVKKRAKKTAEITGFEALNENVLQRNNLMEFIKYLRQCDNMVANENEPPYRIPILTYYSLNNRADENIKTTAQFRALAYQNAFSSNTNNYEDFLNWYRNNEDYENRIRLEKDNNFRLGELKTIRQAFHALLGLFGNPVRDNFQNQFYDGPWQERRHSAGRVRSDLSVCSVGKA